jgi:hypothetical protein
MRNACEILINKPEGRAPLRRLGRDERIILKYMLKK